MLVWQIVSVHCMPPSCGLPTLVGLSGNISKWHVRLFIEIPESKCLHRFAAPSNFDSLSVSQRVSLYRS